MMGCIRQNSVYDSCYILLIQTLQEKKEKDIIVKMQSN